MGATRSTTRWIASAALAAAALLTACDPVPPSNLAAQWNIDELPAGRTLSVAQPGPVADSTGRHPLTVGAGSTASVSVVAGAPGHGTALQFPATGYVDLHAADPATLSPGTRPIEMKLLMATTTAQLDPHGNNVFQQGTFYGDQWKLQVDGGFASCRFADGDVRQGAHAALAVSKVRVDDGAWWSLTCRKAGNTVTVTSQRLGSSAVDTVSVPSEVGSIDSTRPVQVGSKETPSSPDQFHGLLDEISARIG